MEVEIPGVSSLSPKEKQELLLGPAIALPPGVESHFGELPPRSPGILFFLTINAILSTFFVATRIYVRLFIAKSFSFPDVLALIAYGLFVGLISIFYEIALSIGFHVHQWNISLQDYSNYLYSYHIISCLYAAFVLTIKAAILLDWVAIFVPKARSAFFWVSHILLGVNVLFYLAVLILANLLCTPPEHAWDPLTEGHCSDGKRPEVVGAALNSASDVIIFVLPQTVIWKLHMSREQRLGYSILFAIGLAAVAASVARLVSLIYQYHGGDETYNAAPFLLWSLAEMTCIFLVLCVPSTPKAFQNLRLWQHVSSTLLSLGSLVSSPKLALVRTRRPLSQRKMTEPDSHYQTATDNIPLRVVESCTLSSANSVLEA